MHAYHASMHYSCSHAEMLTLHMQGPAIPMIRRHTKGDKEIHFEPATRVVSGNYIAAKRRGVIDGVDFGFTGEVGGDEVGCWGCWAYGHQPA